VAVTLTKGSRFNLSKEAPSLKKVAVGLGWTALDGGYDLDASVFLLGANGKIPDERYFVFYNNLGSPDGAVVHSGDDRKGSAAGDAETIRVDLAKVSASVVEMVFVVTIDGAVEKRQSFRGVANAFIRLYDADTGVELARYNLNESFSGETALEFGKLYRKDGEWRFQAVGQGYNAGLQGFVDRFHDERSAAAPSPVPALPSKVNLHKREFDAVLAKKNLSGVRARVGLALDITGSMKPLYKNGTVQKVVERLLAVAVTFDDDGTLDVWRFDHRFKRLKPATVENFEGYVDREVVTGMDIWGHNDEPPVMRDIVNFYTVESSSRIPAFMIFISDGGVRKDREIQEIVRDSARFPLFWQFVGVGQAKFGALERLDELPGRVVDNASFFAVRDIAAMTDQELYERLMNEFPVWLAAARGKGILS
jgi:stress response protein SCP2